MLKYSCVLIFTAWRERRDQSNRRTEFAVYSPEKCLHLTRAKLENGCLTFLPVRNSNKIPDRFSFTKRKMGSQALQSWADSK